MAIDINNLRRRLDPNSMNRNIPEEEIVELIDEVERLRAVEAQSKPPALSIDAQLVAINVHRKIPDGYASWGLVFELKGGEDDGIEHAGFDVVFSSERQATRIEKAAPSGRWRVCLHAVE